MDNGNLQLAEVEVWARQLLQEALLMNQWTENTLRVRAVDLCVYCSGKESYKKFVSHDSGSRHVTIPKEEYLISRDLAQSLQHV